MPTQKQYTLTVLTLLATFNLFWLIYFILTTEHAYTIATMSDTYNSLILLYIPVGITITSLLIFFFHLVRYKEKTWFAFFPAFIALLPEAIFVIGSLWFVR